MSYEVMNNIFFVVFSTLFGIVIGSFLNVVIYRIPEGRTIVKGHSMCMTCGHELKALDLVPVFSWLFLGGKCRYCKAPISSRYIKIETFTGLIFLTFAITHTDFKLDLFDPFNTSRLIIFAHYCLTLIILASLVSAMMIYHDVSKSYYGYCVVTGISATILSFLAGFLQDFKTSFDKLFISVTLALLVTGAIAVISGILKKGYTAKDFWLDLPFAFFYSYYGKLLIDYRYVFIAALVLLVLPRAIMKKTRYDKYSAIASVCGLLALMIIGYLTNIFISN